VTDVSIVHLSDLHFGGHADLAQAEALEAFVPTLGASAVVVSGDLTQRARHGEFQRALVFVQRLREHAPTLVIPGNHDIEWWKSPLGLRGTRVKYAKYVQYFGDLRPVLEIPGAIIAGALSSYGVAAGSLTWNLRDIAVKGHLPRSETSRVKKLFAKAPAQAVRVLVIHHNILPGAISRRMGLARWRSAQRRLVETGVDLVLCGHDHQEGAGQMETVAVSTAGTNSFRSRQGRPSVFNVVRVEPLVVHVVHYRWEAAQQRFLESDRFSFARAAVPEPVVSETGGMVTEAGGL
jgi:3',5'-cyclic AMP phosphodiesterase CpdA